MIDFVVWRDELMSSLETNRARSKTEESVAGTIGSVEYHKLDSRPRDSFADREALRAYDESELGDLKMLISRTTTRVASTNSTQIR